MQVEVPDALSGIVFLLDEPFPVYRLFLVASGAIVLSGSGSFWNARGSVC